MTTLFGNLEIRSLRRRAVDLGLKYAYPAEDAAERWRSARLAGCPSPTDLPWASGREIASVHAPGTRDHPAADPICLETGFISFWLSLVASTRSSHTSRQYG